jgi:hypothetical protein
MSSVAIGGFRAPALDKVVAGVVAPPSPPVKELSLARYTSLGLTVEEAKSLLGA